MCDRHSQAATTHRPIQGKRRAIVVAFLFQAIEPSRRNIREDFKATSSAVRTAGTLSEDRQAVRIDTGTRNCRS